LRVAAAPGGWTLVRTYENESDDAASCDLEERVLRTETMQGARVSPAPVAVLVRHQKIKLGPREKKAIGVYLPPALTDRMTESDKIARSIAAQVAAGNWSGVDLSRIYSEFRVDYLRPLPPGATAAIPVDNGIRRPERMAMEGSRPQSPKDAL